MLGKALWQTCYHHHSNVSNRERFSLISYQIKSLIFKLQQYETLICLLYLLATMPAFSAPWTHHNHVVVLYLFVGLYANIIHKKHDIYTKNDIAEATSIDLTKTMCYRRQYLIVFICCPCYLRVSCRSRSLVQYSLLSWMGRNWWSGIYHTGQRFLRYGVI